VIDTDDKARVEYLEGNYGKNILPLSRFDNDSRPGSSPIEILFLYRGSTSILKFKDSLLKTLDHYNLFSSRLIMMDDNKFALQYCRDGAIANPLPPIDDSFDNICIDDLKKKIIRVKTLPGEPLFAVTGIPLKDGIFAGISCSHAVADGISVLLFLYAWMCITEGKRFPLPSAQRLFKGPPVDFDKIDKGFVPPLSKLSDEIQHRVKYLAEVKTYTKRESFSDEFLHEMKNKAKSDNEQYSLSKNQIITAFLLKKYHDQILPNTDRIIVRTPINIRDVHPDVDPLYIGNAYFNGFTEFTKDEINQLSLPAIAYRIKESIASMRNEKFVEEVSYLSKYGIEINMDVYNKNRPPFDLEKDISSSNLTHLNDLESLGVGSNIGSVLYIGSAVQTGFTMLQEKSGKIFAEITSRYPLK